MARVVLDTEYASVAAAHVMLISMEAAASTRFVQTIAANTAAVAWNLTNATVMMDGQVKLRLHPQVTVHSHINQLKLHPQITVAVH